jgi:hypothetical protein
MPGALQKELGSVAALERSAAETKLPDPKDLVGGSEVLVAAVKENRWCL